MNYGSAGKTHLEVRSPADGISVLDISGELTAASADALTEAYAQADGPGIKTIVLCFRDLQYMNSSGIGLIVTLLIRARRNGQRLFAAELSDHYRQIFNVTRLDEAIHVFSTEPEALSAAGARRA